MTEIVLSTGLIHRLQVHMLPARFLASALVSRGLHVGQFKSYWQKDTTASSPKLLLVGLHTAHRMLRDNKKASWLNQPLPQQNSRANCEQL